MLQSLHETQGKIIEWGVTWSPLGANFGPSGLPWGPILGFKEALRGGLGGFGRHLGAEDPPQTPCGPPQSPSQGHLGAQKGFQESPKTVSEGASKGGLS